MDLNTSFWIAIGGIAAAVAGIAALMIWGRIK